MHILFAAGHVLGAKIWMGYNEDESMLDLARREARYAADRYGQDVKVFSVTKTSYQAVEDACRGCDIAIFEHSNADDSIDEPNEPNRVVIYRTVKRPGDGPCKAIGQVAAELLDTTLSPIQHRANTSGDDWYGVLKRAMQAGCQDAWLMENGFHTHGPTRQKLSDPMFRQRLAEVKIDAMAREYGWGESDMNICKRGDKNEIVRGVQRGLIRLGYDLGAFLDENDQPTGADASYGPKMSEQVGIFKTKHGLAGGGDVFTVEDNAVLLKLLAAEDHSAEVNKLQEELAAANAGAEAVKDRYESLQDEHRRLLVENNNMDEILAQVGVAFKTLQSVSEEFSRELGY